MKITINDTLKNTTGTTGDITQLLSYFDDKREALILVYLLANADNEGVMTSSIYAIAIELKIHRQTLSRIINHLAQTGWVAIDESTPCTPCKDRILPASQEECQYHPTTTEKLPNVTLPGTNNGTLPGTNNVTLPVTNDVTLPVTNNVTSDVTPFVTSGVTSGVTLSDARKADLTRCVSNECKLGHSGSVTGDVTLGVTGDVTPPVTLDVTEKEEKKQKKEECPPAPPKEEKKQKKEKNTHTNAHARKKNPAEELAERRQQFLATLTPYHERYGQEMVTQFGDYWTEPNRSMTKMRFELQRTWSTPLRLAIWARNDKNFTQNHNNHDKTSRPTSAEIIAHAQRSAIEETERFIREAEIRRGGIPPHLPL